MIKPNVGENYHKRSELEVRVCNMPGSWAHRDFFFLSVFVLIRGTEYIHQALQLGYWERGGGSHSQLQLHLFPSGTSTEKRERKRERGTHTNTVFLKAREGYHRQFTLFKRQSVQKVEQLHWQRNDGSIFSFLIFVRESNGKMDSLFMLCWFTWSDRNSWERCWAAVGLERLDDLVSNFEGWKKWAEFKDQSGFYWKSLKRSTLKEKRSDQLNRSGPPRRRRVLAVPASSRWDEQWRLDICMGQKYVL